MLETLGEASSEAWFKGIDVIPSLIRCLSDSKPVVRCAAAQALGNGPRWKTIEVGNGERYGSASFSFGERVANMMRTTNHAVEPLINALNDADSHVQARAAEALGKLCDKRAVAPLNLAIETCHGDVRKIILNVLQKLKDNISEEALKEESRLNRALLHKACEEDNLDVVQKLTDKDANINHCYLEESSLLNKAIGNGHLNVVKLLIDKGADVNLKDGRGFSPLQMAVDCKQPNIIQLLLHKGVDLINDGGRALSYACMLGVIEVVKYWIDDGGDVNRVVPIILADSFNHYLHIVPPSTSDEIKINGMTLIHVASVAGHIDIVRLLLDNSTEVDMKNSLGATPLMWAAYNARTGIIQILLNSGADIKIADNEGRTALDYTQKKGHRKKNIEKTRIALQKAIDS